MPQTQEAIEQLLAIEQIRQLKARYFRCMDSKDWSGFQQLFTDDAVFDMRNGRGPMLDPEAIIHGAAAIMAYARDGIQDLITVHHGHMPEIELTSADRATGIWAMEDLLFRPEHGSAPFESMRGYGHYHETYRRDGDRWRIARLKLTRLRVDVVPLG